MIRLTLIFFLMLMIFSCRTARRGEPFSGMMLNVSDEVSQGQIIFNRHCTKCHPGGEGGEGPSLNNLPLPGTFIKMKVRSKAVFLYLGKMPSFTEDEISKKELTALVAYLKKLRRHSPEA